jgi:hypothetical protein
MHKLKSHPRVEYVDDERAIGNSIIVTLRAHWTFTPGEDNRVGGADTIKEALLMVRAAHHYAGPLDP